MEMWSLAQKFAILIGPLVSGLVAAFTVHLLTRRREREQWLLDCKKQEYKELMSAISNAYIELLNIDFSRSQTAEEKDRWSQARANSVRVIRDRIFISDAIKPDSMSNRWLRAMEKYEVTLDSQTFHTVYEELRGEIVTAANLSISKKTMQRLAF